MNYRESANEPIKNQIGKGKRKQKTKESRGGGNYKFSSCRKIPEFWTGYPMLQGLSLK